MTLLSGSLNTLLLQLLLSSEQLTKSPLSGIIALKPLLPLRNKELEIITEVNIDEISCCVSLMRKKFENVFTALKENNRPLSYYSPTSPTSVKHISENKPLSSGPKTTHDSYAFKRSNTTSFAYQRSTSSVLGNINYNNVLIS